MSYYETPSIPAPGEPAYLLQETNAPNGILPPPSISSSFGPPPTLEELFAQVDPRVGCAGNSVPLVQRASQHLDHLQQTQRYRDQDPFAAPPRLI